MELELSVSKLNFVGPIYARRLKRLDIHTVSDLLHHIPHRYQDFRIISDIERAQIGEIVTIKAKVLEIKNVYTKKRKILQKAIVADQTGEMQIIWFNQRYLVKNIEVGKIYSFAGKVDWFDKRKTLISPEYEKVVDKVTLHTGRLVPIYPETYKLSSKWLRGRIFYSLSKFKPLLEEFLPKDILLKNNLMDFQTAIEKVHFPETLEEAQKGRKRLSLNELLFYQLRSLYRKSDWKKIKVNHKLFIDKKLIKIFIDSLPFELTKSQKKAIEEIFNDLKSEHPMNRLLEGDVGSGKTVVSAACSFASFVNGYQTVFMAPTQILANQHFNTLKNLLEKFKVRIELVTSSINKKDFGKTDIFVGTHALIHKKVSFDSVALVVIDEQHRFGVEQRSKLIKKSSEGRKAPHVLTMTATPIPRTVALTIYGDLDLSTLDELPKGRKPITTWLVPPQKREAAYKWIEEKIKNEKVQGFVICPLIEESEVETMKQVKAATKEFERLKIIFQTLKIGLLHGKQNADKKNEVLESFKKGDIDILVATPVVEVGIDVPNATLMIIEASERFGLAQLHQLRGRIGRGEKKSYCLLFTESKSEKVLKRLNALKENKSGFELAELDLKLRGPGEIFGTRQHGFPELKIASWQDTELIKKAREIAQEAINSRSKFQKLFQKLESQNITPN